MTNASISPASSLPFVTNIGVDAVQGAAIASFRADVEAALRQKDYSLALRRTADGVERFVQHGNRYGEATALFLQGMVYRYLENCPAALRCLKASHALWEFLNDSDGVTRCLQELGGTSIQQADYTAAMVYFQECLRLCEQSRDRRREIATRSNLATLHLEVGDCAAGLEGLLRCLVHYEEEGKPDSIAGILHNIAEAYLMLGQFEEAIRCIRRGYGLWESAPAQSPVSPEIACHLLSSLGTAYRKTGRFEEAQTSLQQALVHAEDAGVRWMMALILSDRGALFIEQRRFEEAQDALLRSLALNGKGGHLFIHAQALKRLGILYTNTEFSGRSDTRALELLEEARRVAQECDSPMLLVPVYTALSDVYERQGDLTAALSSLRCLRVTEKRLFNAESDRRIQRLELEKARQEAEILHLRNVELASALAEAERLRHLADESARTDALTGLLNRRALNERFAEEWERSLRYRRPFAIALLDIDHFKRINDTLGHSIGDQTLVRMAALLRSSCRPGDQVARYGGEEFALLFPESSLSAAAEICERLRERVATEDWSTIHPGLEMVTISLGVGAFDGNPNSLGKLSAVGDLLREADMHLYRAKQAGRNQVFSASIQKG